MAGRKKVSEYECKRSFDRTPEPRGRKRKKAAKGNRFVIQEHHARRLHWDLRLEHDGTLVSFALPRGVPQDPKQNRLAVHTEDHPLEYLEFEGDIPKGQYGAGKMRIWDRGTFEAEKFRENEVIAVFDGEQMKGKYALFQTNGDNWMIHRMDPPADPDRQPMPEHLRPMAALLSTDIPRDDENWGYEIKWDGIRAIAYCETGRLRLESRTLRDITPTYPELRPLAAELGSRDAVLDGEIVAFDDEGNPSFERLQGRMNLASDAAVRRRMGDCPVTYLVFDVLYLEGRTLMDLPYTERRERLEDMGLNGPNWQTPTYHQGDGKSLLDLTRQRGLEGLVAKRLDSRYLPGRRTRAWLKVKNLMGQEFVIGGWLPGQGRRAGTLGALLVGYHEDEDGKPALRYAGRVGTGFSDEELDRLSGMLEPLRAEKSPFTGRQPPRESVFVEPELVAEVAFREWTRARTLRAPVYKGLRPDKKPEEVVFEQAQPPP
ncbi:MAG: DNA ligase [Actinobacteria bacterium]|nr:MAG: DNA ligase [Actinomycetota bacterium]